MSDQPPFSDYSSFLGWNTSPLPQLPFAFDEESFPAGIDPLNDEQSSFNGPWRSYATCVPLAGASSGDAPPPPDTSAPDRTAFGGSAAGMPPAAMVASTPRSRLFADAALSVEAAQKISSLEFDDSLFRSWQESATPLPPLHVAGNQLRFAVFPG